MSHKNVSTHLICAKVLFAHAQTVRHVDHRPYSWAVGTPTTKVLYRIEDRENV